MVTFRKRIGEVASNESGPSKDEDLHLSSPPRRFARQPDEENVRARATSMSNASTPILYPVSRYSSIQNLWNGVSLKPFLP
ncbi:MAG: hypothetical protein HYY13_01910 [Nitrospirae bacterium]|nr:hypothetical protein [Nitrospirota bacterium]